MNIPLERKKKKLLGKGEREVNNYYIIMFNFPQIYL